VGVSPADYEGTMSDMSLAFEDLVDAEVESWRLTVLLDAGYPPELAEQIAESKADLHAAVALLERGCPPPLAARIIL
jgi:hypothetical protein